MATLESIQRLKYLLEIRNGIKKNDIRATVRALGNYQEWYIGRDEPKTNEVARTAARKFINSLRGRDA